MRRADVDPRLGFCINPAAEDAAARKDEGMRAIVIDDGQLKVAVERCSRYRVPIHGGNLHLLTLQALSYVNSCESERKR
jgi:hypothetical protein